MKITLLIVLTVTIIAGWVYLFIQNKNKMNDENRAYTTQEIPGETLKYNTPGDTSGSTLK